MLGDVHEQVVVGVSRHVEELQREAAEGPDVPVRQGDLRPGGRAPVGGQRGPGELPGTPVPVGVVGVAVGVQDELDLQALGLGAVHEGSRLEGRVDEGGHSRAPVPEQVPEVPVSSRPDLLEHEVHGVSVRLASWLPPRGGARRCPTRSRIPSGGPPRALRPAVEYRSRVP